MNYKIGDIVEGEITGIQPYGAFVLLEDKEQGLIHVSEIQSGYTKNIHQYLRIGQKVQAKIIDIDDYTQKISLSLRAMETRARNNEHYKKRYFNKRNQYIGFKTIQENLPVWVKIALDDLANKKNKHES